MLTHRMTGKAPRFVPIKGDIKIAFIFTPTKEFITTVKMESIVIYPSSAPSLSCLNLQSTRVQALPYLQALADDCMVVLSSDFSGGSSN